MRQFIEQYHDKAVERIITAMQENPEKSEYFYSGAGLCECFGWDGGVMSPVTRQAFVTAFGEETTARLEADAKAKLASASEMGAKYREHEAAAVETAKKPVNEWVVGDYVVALDCGLKFDHGNLHEHMWDFIEGEAEDKERDAEWQHVRRRLCRITRIENKPAGFFNEPQALENYKPREDEQCGSCSDDLPDDYDLHGKDPQSAEYKAAISTFYTLGVLIRTADGEWVIVDSEGYSYPRYVLVPQDYRAMFAPVIETIRARKEIERKEREAAAKAELDRQKAEYDARCAKWSKHMHLVGDTSWKVIEQNTKANVLAMARAAFPLIHFNLRKDHGWGNGWILSWTNGPTKEEVKTSTDFGLFCETWDTFDSMTDCSGIGHAKFNDFAKRYGSVRNGIELERKEAATDRNRKEPPQTIAEPPSAVSLDGEITITENTEKNGIEIRFTRKPSDAVLERIKSRRCWRWSRYSKCWYTRANQTERDFAHALADGK